MSSLSFLLFVNLCCWTDEEWRATDGRNKLPIKYIHNHLITKNGSQATDHIKVLLPWQRLKLTLKNTHNPLVPHRKTAFPVQHHGCFPCFFPCSPLSSCLSYCLLLCHSAFFCQWMLSSESCPHPGSYERASIVSTPSWLHMLKNACRFLTERNPFSELNNI